MRAEGRQRGAAYMGEHSHVRPAASKGRLERGRKARSFPSFLVPPCGELLLLAEWTPAGRSTAATHAPRDLQACKQLFGINDDNYYAVSTAVAGIMMGM